MGVAEAAETVVDEEVDGVSATSTCTRGTLASHGTTKTHGTVPMVEAGIMGVGDITNLRTTHTLPRLNPTTIRTGGTHHKTTIRTTNRAGTEAHLSRRMTRGLHINHPLTEVAEEGIIQDMMARTAPGRMGTAEGEVRLLLIGGARRTAAVDTEIKEVREGCMGTAAMVVGTTSPSRTAITAEVEAIMEVVIISLVEAINPVAVINPVGHTTLVLSLTGTKEDTTKEAEAVGGDIDYQHADADMKTPSRLASSTFSPALSRL